MSSATPLLLGVRLRGANPNHHLWKNHGTWFLHYTFYPTPFTKGRIHRSLGTKDVKVARQRRDVFFARSGIVFPEATETTHATLDTGKRIAA